MGDLKREFTRVANDILDEVMKLNLSASQLRIIIAVWRWTYGFQRPEYEMPSNFISRKTGIHAAQVRREVKSLCDRNILIQKQGKRGAWILAFNKYHDQWTGKEVKPMPDKKTKSKKPDKYPEDSTYYKMAVYFHGKVSAVAKDAGVEHLIKKANLQSWADDMRKLMELDQVDKDLARQVMDWVTQHHFWRTNVLSASKLRQKFPELAIKMKAEQQPVPKKQAAPDPRDRDIALQRWIAEGKDPDEFTWR